MRSSRTLLLLAAALPLPAVAGCITDVGACDPVAARQIVYRVGMSTTDPQNGLPMYAGQALVSSGCGGTQYCHSSGTRGPERLGVPAGFDFDLDHACTDDACPPFAPEAVAADPTRYAGLVRLHANQRTVLRWTRHILDAMRTGSMPPGAEGARVEALGASFSIPDFAAGDVDSIHADGLWAPCDDDTATVDVPDCTDSLASERRNNVVRYWDLLPRITAPGGREIVRNWLACGAPVIEATTNLGDPGTTCSAPGDTVHVGDCFVRMPPDIIPPDPTWDSIYAKVIAPLCGTSCHTPSDAGSLGRSRLDLSDIDGAYAAMWNAHALGDECREAMIADGPRYVDTDAPESSLLLRKLVARPTDPPMGFVELCGDRMIPNGPFLPSDVTDPILEWIQAGAPR